MVMVRRSTNFAHVEEIIYCISQQMPYKYMATGKDLFVLSNKAKAQEQQRPLLKGL